MSALNNKQWFSIRGSGSRRCPEENMSLAAEIFVEHQRFDEHCSLSHSDGILLNRHLWRERYLQPPKQITAQDPGEDEADLGAHISLAAQEKGSDGLGGELPLVNGESAHQREFTFLQQHVVQAYQAYQSHYSPWPQTELNDWQKVEALARYASRWKMRTANVYASFHPVDVLFHSSYCTGAANILQALAMVAGFQTRFIAISHHSTVEIHVNGRWVWADNIVANGGVTPNTFNYADMTSDPHAIPSFTSAQRELYDSATSRYRSPYSLSASYYWHFMSGDSKERGKRDDISDGYGLSIPYDPSTACALYPELKLHRFFSPKGWQPSVNISEKGSLIRSRFELIKGSRLRKVFYIGKHDDNPITRGIVKIRLAESCQPQQVQCYVDGKNLPACMIGIRFKENCLDCIIPAKFLSEGLHAFEIECLNQSVACILYPDPLLPYFNPYSTEACTLADQSFSIEPCIGPKQLAALSEPVLT